MANWYDGPSQITDLGGLPDKQGVEDLAAMVRRGGEGGAEVDMGVKLQKQANKTLNDIFFQIRIILNIFKAM